jgi:glycosyltransferase involved in cell wall biosynthesis
MNVGGTARYVGKLVEKIPNSKLATGYVQGSEIEDACAQELEVLRIQHMGRRISPLNDFRAWVELRKVIKEVKPLIVHTHTFKAGLIARLVGGTHKRVHTFHGHLFDDQSFSFIEKKMIRLAERYLARRTNLLISVGKKVGDELRAQGIGTNQNWLSIPPGVEALPTIEGFQARKALGLNSDSLLIGWMARMTEVKNPTLLLEVARHLPEFNFVMAGGGNMLEEIREAAPKNVQVIGWADAAAFWSAVDCAISTSDNEGMPISLIEAQLAGVPVIATNVGSTDEVVENGVTGILSTKDALGLISAIRKVTSDVALFESMKNASKERARKEFTPLKMLTSHTKVYLKLLT